MMVLTVLSIKYMKTRLGLKNDVKADIEV